MSVDRHDEVRVNEFRLVYTMVPLDKIIVIPWFLERQTLGLQTLT